MKCMANSFEVYHRYSILMIDYRITIFLLTEVKRL